MLRTSFPSHDLPQKNKFSHNPGGHMSWGKDFESMVLQNAKYQILKDKLTLEIKKYLQIKSIYPLCPLTSFTKFEVLTDSHRSSYEN